MSLLRPLVLAQYPTCVAQAMQAARHSLRITDLPEKCQAIFEPLLGICVLTFVPGTPGQALEGPRDTPPVTKLLKEGQSILA